MTAVPYVLLLPIQDPKNEVIEVQVNKILGIYSRHGFILPSC